MWTEMRIDTRLIHANSPYLDMILDYKPNEHPIVCQLGGCNPAFLVQAALCRVASVNAYLNQRLT